MPSGASAWERFFVRLVRAALAAVYATRPGLCRRVEWAETLTIRANEPRRRAAVHGEPCGRRSGPRCRRWPATRRRRGPSKARSRPRPVPAVFTSTSRPSQRSPRRSISASTSVRLVRSAANAMLSGLPPECSVATVSSSASLARASTATRAPSRAKVSAAARPIPRDPPTTSTRASAKPEIHVHSSLRRALCLRARGVSARHSDTEDIVAPRLGHGHQP